MTSIMHTSALDHASESTAGLTGQDRAERRSCRAPEQKRNKHVPEPSNEPMQRPAVHKCSGTLALTHTHTRTNRTHAHTEQKKKKNHNPKKQELTHGFHISSKVTFKFDFFFMWTIGQRPNTKNWIPLEAERVNSVKCKHPANNLVYTLSRWPALLIGKQQK